MRLRLAAARTTWKCRQPIFPIPQARTLLTRAFIEGSENPPLLEQTVGQHFASVVSRYGDRKAVISHHQQIQLTYDKLDRNSNALARGLASAGVKKGDRFAVMLGNNIEFATVTYALFKLGAVLVPLNPAFTSAQVISALRHLDACHLMIGIETTLPRKLPSSNVPLLADLATDLSSRRLESEAVPSLKEIVLVDNSHGRIDVSEMRATTPFRVLQENGDNGQQTVNQSLLDPNDTVNIQFTSGTTSMPKAAMLTHRNILNNGNSIGDRMLLTAEDVVVSPPPLFHCFGCILGYMATATHGSAIVWPSESFDPLLTLQAVQEHGGTALYGVPTMFLAELELLAKGIVERKGLERLRTGIAAGSSIPAELMRKLHRELNLTELTICYGMTETSPVSAMTTTDDPMQKRIETVGRLLPHVKAKVVDPLDSSRILDIGERGELAVAGYLLMKGYYGDKTRTDEVLFSDENGEMWMHTGDEASIDEDGYITITGRIKDLIIRGGENIHPLEIESCLLGHPSILEVSVVGTPDERYGEVVSAFIVRRDPVLKSEEVQTWVRERLSHHLVPKYIFWVDDFPKTASGKHQKFKLRQMSIGLLAAEKAASS